MEDLESIFIEQWSHIPCSVFPLNFRGEDSVYSIHIFGYAEKKIIFKGLIETRTTKLSQILYGQEAPPPVCRASKKVCVVVNELEKAIISQALTMVLLGCCCVFLGYCCVFPGGC